MSDLDQCAVCGYERGGRPVMESLDGSEFTHLECLDSEPEDAA